MSRFSRFYLFFVAGLLCYVSADAQRKEALRYIKAADSLFFIKPDSSVQLAAKGLEIALQLKDDTLAAKAYHSMGTAEGIQGHFAPAQQGLMKALALFERLGLEKQQMPTLGNMARVIEAQGRYADAIRYLKRALVLDKRFDDQDGVAYDYQNIGFMFRRWGRQDSALHYYNLSIQHAQAHNVKDKKGIMASSHYNISYLYSLQGRYAEAAALLKEPIAYYDSIGDQFGILHGVRYRANLAYLTGAYSEALSIAIPALEQSKAAHMDEIISSLLEIIADSYEAKHQHAEALKYYKEYKVLSDTIYNAEKARIVAELQYAYEAEKKDNEIQLLKKEEERQRIIIILISVAALAATFLVVVLLLSKKLQAVRYRAREAHLEAEHEKAQLELESSQRELIATTSFLQQKNKLLETLQEEVASLSADADQSQHPRLADMTHALTQAKLLTDDDWEQFRQRFEKVYPGFFFRLREQFYDLTPAETRLMALTHLNLSTREIASMLGVSDQTVYKTRQRLRAKIGRSAEMGLRDLEADVA